MTDFTSTTVSVGLDVHAASIRLAAVHADELLDERTLLYDHEALCRQLARWPGGRAAMRPGRRASVSIAICRERHRLRGGRAGARADAPGRSRQD